MKENDIEDVFKKSFENYEPEVGSKVWKNIKVFLKWGGLAFFINTLIQKIGLTTLLTVAVSIVAVVGGAVAYNWNDDKKATPIAEQAVLENDSNNPVISTSIDNNTAEQVVSKKSKEEKNTSVVVEKTIKIDESLALIEATITSGTAPLIVDFSNKGKGKSCVWVFSDQNKEIASAKPIHVFDAVGTHSVFLTSTNADGSVDTDTLSIEVTGSIPKAITVSPNGDGINDEFKLDLQKMASINSKIIDKNGVIVYQSQAAGEWTGKDLKGNELPAGFYYYTILAEGLNGKKYDQKGIVNLKR